MVPANLYTLIIIIPAVNVYKPIHHLCDSFFDLHSYCVVVHLSNLVIEFDSKLRSCFT